MESSTEPPEGSSTSPSLRELYESLLSFSYSHYLHTRNPIYVWQVLAWFLCPENNRQLRCAVDSRYPPWTGELPDWVKAYLYDCASAVDRMAYDVEISEKRVRKEKAKKCASRIAGTFGFVGFKSNAFSLYITDKMDTYIALEFSEKRADGLTADEALTAAAQPYMGDIQDTTHARRRVARGRRLYKPPCD